MKRVGGLFEALVDLRTITAAAWRAARGKRDRPEVRDFFGRFDEESARLVHELGAGTFRFGSYRTFSIRDPKSRLIHAPPFRDRVVHHALVAIAGPILERGAGAHSYACRTGRGQHAALRQAARWLRRDGWFLKLDVAKYYDSIDHDLLRVRLARRFREQRLLVLFDRLLESYAKTPRRGLPIGALTSQYLGNFYLDPFDHWVNEAAGVHSYLRYLDDLLFLGDYPTLTQVRGPAESFLAAFGLSVKHHGQLNRCDLGVPYLGFVLYPDRVRLNAPGRRRLRRRVGELERAWLHGRVDDPTLQARGEALFAHVRFGDDVNWRRLVVRFSHLGEQLEPAPRPAGRLVEQFRQELPSGLSQPERAG